MVKINKALNFGGAKMKTLILIMGIVFVVCLGMYVNIAQAEYPQSTTSPLTVDLDFNGKNITNAGIGTFNGVRIPAGDMIMTGLNEAIYTNATNSNLTIRSNGTGKLSLNPSSSGVVEIGNDVYIKGPRPWIDVRAYGASPNASAATNDAAFAAAIAAIPAEGAIVFVPGGVYTVSDSITFTSKYVDFVGAGKGVTTLKFANSVNKNMLVIDPSPGANPPAKATMGVRVAHMRIEGNAANQTLGSGIRIKSGMHILVEDVHVVDFKEHGVHINGASSSLTVAIVLIGNQTRIEYNQKNGVHVGQFTDGVVIDGAWLGDNGTTGTDSYNVYAELAASLRVMNCWIWQGKRANIRIHAFQNWQIVGNYIISAPRQQIIITGTAATGSAIGNIVGNHFSSGSEEAANTYAHIQIGESATSKGSSITITGNTFSNPIGFPVLTNVDEDANSNNNSVFGNSMNGTPMTITLRGSGSEKAGNTPEGATIIKGLRVAAGDIVMTGPNQVIYTNAANSDLTVRSNGTGKLLLNPSTSGRVDIGNSTYGVTIGDGTGVILKHLFAMATWDPPSLSNGSVASTTVTVTGAAKGDIAYASHNEIGVNDVQITAHVQAADTVRVVLRNVTGGTLDIPSSTLRVNVWKY